MTSNEKSPAIGLIISADKRAALRNPVSDEQLKTINELMGRVGEEKFAWVVQRLSSFHLKGWDVTALTTEHASTLENYLRMEITK